MQHHQVVIGNGSDGIGGDMVIGDHSEGMVTHEEHEMVMIEHPEEQMVVVDGEMEEHHVVMVDHGQEMVMEGHEMVVGEMADHVVESSRKRRHDDQLMARHAAPLYCSTGSVTDQKSAITRKGSNFT